MKRSKLTPPLYLLSYLLFFLFLASTFASKKSYVVFLGEHSLGPELSSVDLNQVTESHHKFLGPFLKSGCNPEDVIFYSYTRHINGFAAKLEDEEAADIAKHPKVVSVCLNRRRKLPTTHSWEFLGLENNGSFVSNSIWKKARYGEDTIIGNLDSGVRPESESFIDEAVYGLNGKLSELISQLRELLKGVKECETSPFKYDCSLLAAQIQQLSQEIKDLSLSRPVTIYNGGSSSSGGYASYLMPAAALVAMGYCYMWWKGWSFSDVMFVTKHNMANAVAIVSKQLENVYEALDSMKTELSKRLGNLDQKVEEQMEKSELIANDVNEMKSNLSQIRSDLKTIYGTLSGMGNKLELFEGKQDWANSHLLYLCQVAGSSENALNVKPSQEVSVKIADHSSPRYEDKSFQGLQLLAKTSEEEVIEKSIISPQKSDLASHNSQKVLIVKNKDARVISSWTFFSSRSLEV